MCARLYGHPVLQNTAGPPKKVWPVAIAIFATIVNPALTGNDLGFVKVNPII